MAGTTYSIAFAEQVELGTYEVHIGPQIENLEGAPMDQDSDGIGGEEPEDRYDFSFDIIDLSGPRVISHTPSGSATAPVDFIDILFNEAIDPASFGIDDVSITGPGGDIVPNSVTQIDGQSFSIAFASEDLAGTYNVVIGPRILDISGNEMDQDEDLINGEEEEDQYTASFYIASRPHVTGHTPVGDQINPVSQVTVTFNEAVNEDTFTADDIEISGPSGAIAVTSGPAIFDGTTYIFGFDEQVVPGTYHVSVGPQIENPEGALMDQDGDGIQGEPEDRYDFTFDIVDLVGPRVLSHMPSGSVTPPISYLDIYFNEEIDPASFDVDDVSITGPAGDIDPDFVSQLDGSKFRISFAEQVFAGIYQIVIGPHILDMSGNEMDQDEDLINGEAEEDQYSAYFSIISRPQIISHTPSGDQTEPVGKVTVTFNKEIQSATFTQEDIEVVGPAGAIAVTSGPTPLGGAAFDIGFDVQVELGTYHVYIGPQITDLDGTLMDQDGDGIQGEPLEDRYDAMFVIIDVTGPLALSHTPSGSVAPPIDYQDIHFNEEIDDTSFTVNDVSITGPAGSVAPISVNKLDGNSFRVIFASQTVEGNYEVTVGPDILDVAGNPMDQDQDKLTGETFDDRYIATFIIDSGGPKVIAHSVSGKQNITVRFIDVTFSEAIAPSTFTKEKVTVAGPDGSYNATEVTQVEANVYRIELPPKEMDGTYHVTIAPTIRDVAGNAMDQDEDGNKGETDDDKYEFEFIQELPDLLVSQIKHPAEVQAGQPFEVTWTVTNNGLGCATGQWSDTVYISEDAQVGDDTQAGQGQYNQPLEPGQSYTRTISIAGSDSIEVNRWIIVTTDSKEEVDEQGAGSNNTTVAESPFWVTTRPYPDLQVTEVIVPEALPAGEKATISWTVRNLGDVATSASYWNDALYLSANITLDPSDIKVASIRNADFLAQGESYTQTQDIAIPETTPRGFYYLLVKTDADDNVEEFDLEDNNILESTNTTDVITPAPGCLTVQSVEAPASAEQGSDITITWTVKNTGGATIVPGWVGGYWDDGVALSRDQIYNENEDHWLGGHLMHHGEPLGPGETYTYTRQPRNSLPNWEPGTYYLILIPDCHWFARTLGETVLKNYGVTPIILSITNPSDLQVTFVQSPALAVSGQEVTLSWTVQNTGTGETNRYSWSDTVFLSTDQTLDEGDQEIGGVDHTGLLNPGETYEVTAKPFRIPDGIEGDYYVLIKTDKDNQVYESDEMNNVLAGDAPISIQVIASDLQIQSATGPATGVAGQKISVRWTVCNAGTEATFAESWKDRVYLSGDEALDPQQDTQLGEYAHTTALDPGGTYTQNQDFMLPTGIEGPHHIFVVTDAENQLYEHNAEDNNSFQISPPIEISDLAPDLGVQSFTTPGSGVAGQPIQVDWSVVNSGTATANPSWEDAIYLSKDNTLDTEADTPLHTFERSEPLDTGASYGPLTTPTEILLPELPEHVEGTYYLFFIADKDDRVYEKGSEQNNVSSPQAITLTEVAPDLLVQNASAPAQGISGQFITVDWTIQNIGDAATAGPWKDAFYLSEDAAFNKDEDRLIGLFEHTIPLESGQTAGRPTDPAMVLLPYRTAGTYRIFVVTDAEGSVYEKGAEANNVFLVGQPIEVTYSPADLQVSIVRSPSEATAGTAVNVSWTVENRGEKSTDESYWYDGVYISSDNIFEPASDIELGMVSYSGALAASDSYSKSESFVLRQDIEGPYYVYVVTDARHQVYEHDKEDNNTTSSPEQMQVAGVHADLRVTALTVPGTAIAGNNAEIIWTVINEGTHETPGSSWEDTVYLSTDSDLDDEDVILGVYKHNGALDSGASYLQTKTVHLRQDDVGNFFVIVKTDSSPFNDVYEYGAEENNTHTAPLVIDLSPTPDLQVTNIDAPETAWSGQYITVEWAVTNVGAVPAVAANGFWFDSVYLSRDPYLDVDNDIQLGNVQYNGQLPASDTYSQSLNGRLPPGASGPYYVIVRTDSSIPDHVFERDMEGNNVSVAETTVEINLSPPADLQVTSVTPPTSGILGEPATWTYVVTNAGTLPAVGAWYDTLYLSADQQWDFDDPRIARVFHQEDVAQGENYTGEVTTNIPAVTPGGYYVIARTDILDDVREIDETNNTGTSVGTMLVEKRELTIDQATAGTIAAGQYVYYQVMASEGDDLVINLSGDAGNCAEVYVAHGRIPSRSDFDFRAEVTDSNERQIRIPGAKAGPYYVLVYGYDCSETSSFEITASVLADLVIMDLTLDEGSNTGTVTTRITGANFQPEIEARLEDDSQTVVVIGTVLFEDAGHLSATFDLTGLTPGSYWLVLENPDGKSCAEAFNVIEGQQGELFARLLIPSLVRPGRPYTFTLEYGNVGSADIPAPLIVISAAEGALLRLFPSEDFHDKPIQVLAIAEENPVDILPPGSSYTIEMEFKLTTTEYVPFYIKIMDRPDVPIDWDAVESALRPDDADPSIWDPMLENLQAQLGETWGDYVQVLRDDAVRLALRGERTYDVRELFGMEVNVAYGGAKGAITGYVFESDTGYAVAGATVIAYQPDGSGYAQAVTESDGSFMLTGLPIGHYMLVVEEYILTQGIEGDVTDETDWLNQKLYVMPGAEISGYVEENAKPLADALISIRGETTVYSSVARTDFTGYYRIPGLPEDTYIVTASADGYVEETLSDLSIGKGELRNNIDFNLVKGAKITGRVTDAFTGQVIEDASVVAAIDDGHVFSAFTDENGDFTINSLAEGEWEVYALAEDYATSEKKTVNLNAQGTATLNFALLTGATVSGIITDSSGNPIADAIVFAEGDNGNTGFRTTDENGYYEITGLVQDNYTITVRADGYMPGAQNLGELSQGETLTEINLQLNEGIIVSGIVTEEDGTTPIYGALLVFQSTSGETYILTSKDDGSFTGNQFAPGKYSLNVKADGYHAEQYTIEVPDSGALTGLKISLLVDATALSTLWDSRELSDRDIRAQGFFQDLKCPFTPVEEWDDNCYSLLWLEMKGNAWVGGIILPYASKYLRKALNRDKSPVNKGPDDPIAKLGIKIHPQYLDHYWPIKDYIWYYVKYNANNFPMGTSKIVVNISSYSGTKQLNFNNFWNPSLFMTLGTAYLDIPSEVILTVNRQENNITYSGTIDFVVRDTYSFGRSTHGPYTVLHWPQNQNPIQIINLLYHSMHVLEKKGLSCTYPITVNLQQEVRGSILLPPPDPPGDDEDGGGSGGHGAHDPNDKLISIGHGTLHHILNDETIEYTIRFENDKDAQASAQLITITDPLSDKLDWSTFELGDIEFGNHHIDVPEGLNYYFTRVDLRPEGKNLFVDIEANFDPGTGVVRWTFTAINPDTGELTEDVLAGFLPPNGENHEGEGYAKFRIRPKADLENGTKIENVATIVFDWNEPMDTPLVFNTIDIEAPSSQVSSLPATSNVSFDVKWTGQDDENGSGIAFYDIYISKDGGDYELWLDDTTATAGGFAGEMGSTYAFYSIAADNVGNIELVPTEPDAITTIVMNYAPSDPYPRDNATGISIRTGLWWNAGHTADTYELYLWQDGHGKPQTPLVSGLTITTCKPASLLLYGTTYYWQIVAKGAYGETEGPEWSFTTFAADGDSDEDGLTNEEEITLGTDPFVTDTDGDEYADGEEVDTGSNPLNELSYPTTTTIHLKKGFNLIAIPENLAHRPDLKDWLAVLGDSSVIEKVLAYNDEAGTFVTLLPGDLSSEGFALKGGEGLILYATQDKEITFATVLCSTLDLKPGFNLAGIACPQEGYSAFQLLNDLGSENVTSIQKYSTEKGAFETAGFGPDGQVVGVDFPIIPGEGYFVYIK